MKTPNVFSFLIMLVGLNFSLSSQAILLEEFTNLESVDYSSTHNWVDSVAAEFGMDLCIIKYHTDMPAGDPFSDSVAVEVTQRINTIGGIGSTPYVVIDGNILPAGSNPDGATKNLMIEDLENALSNKVDLIDFFGLDLSFSTDLKRLSASSGLTTVMDEDLSVIVSTALVEEVVETDPPLGPNGETSFTHVFRKFTRINNFEVIPGVGSHFQEDFLDIPAHIDNLSNLKMVVFVSDTNGNIIDCACVDGPDVNAYHVEIRNVTEEQDDFCDNEVVPAISVRNIGALPLNNFTVAATINGQVYSQSVNQSLAFGDELTVYFDNIVLLPGQHKINVGVDLGSTNPDLIVDNLSIDQSLLYLVRGDHAIPEEGFESTVENDLGNLMLQSQHDFAFTKVIAEDLGLNDPIGAFGQSDQCIMVDQWNWEWNVDDGSSVWNPYNRNFSSLIYNGFVLDGIEKPRLMFDIAAASNSWNTCLEVGITTDTCTDNYIVLESFMCPDIITTSALDNDMYVPQADDWKSFSIDLDSYIGDEVQIRFLTWNDEQDVDNAFYLDNIRVVSADVPCEPGDIHLTSQAEVDAFEILIQNCSNIGDNICIGYCEGEDISTDITDLSGLSNLVSIGGYLHIQNNPSLSNLNGLENIKSIGNYLEVKNNEALATAEKLSLNSVGGNVIFEDNGALQTFIDMANMDLVNGDFRIKNSPLSDGLSLGKLREIKGNCTIAFVDSATTLGSTQTDLTSIGGSLSVTDCAALKFVHVFGDLDSIGDALEMRSCPNVFAVSMNDLVSIGSDMVIKNISSITTMSFGKLDIVGGDIVLAENDMLKDIATLDGLQEHFEDRLSADTVRVHLLENDSLNVCDTELICMLLNHPNGEVAINANGMSCQSQEQVVNQCTISSTEDSSDMSYEIYPNPTSGHIEIKGFEDVRFEAKLYDLSAKLVLQSSSSKIDLSQFSSGIYFIAIIVEGHTVPIIDRIVRME